MGIVHDLVHMPEPASAELWSPEEFTARLRAVGEQKYHDKHPFHIRMHAGELSEKQVQGWVANRFYYQKNLPVKDAAIVSRLPNREMRREWLQRIIDHDGREGDEGGIEAWVQLGVACGLTREEILDGRHVAPGARFAVDAYVNFARNAPWVLAVGSSLTELFAPGIVGNRIGVFEKHYPWIDTSGLQYFRNRLHQAPRDADHALDVVISYSRTRADQERVVKALEFKCDVLWSLCDAIEQAFPD